MKQKAALIILFSLTLTGLILIGHSSLSQLACEGQPINNNVAPTLVQQIWGEQIVGQSFTAPRDGLNRIDILFQTYRRQNTHDVTLRLLELPANLDNPLEGIERFSTTFNAAAIRDQAWHTFALPPIDNSKGRRYLITLHSPESEFGDAITVGGIERDVYLPGSAFLGPTPLPADMAFRTCYQMTIGTKLRVLAEQMTQNRPGLWGSSAFYGVSLLLYAGLVTGFFWKLSQQ